MEEVADLVPEMEYPEVPEPPPLKSANKLSEKIACEDCGKQLSLHAYK